MINNINYDVFLEYLSYLKNGSWQQFKKYIDNLDYDNKGINYTDIQKMFSRLGHIEFSFEGKGEFSVCPSTICLNRDSSEGILSGYRTKEFLSKIKYEFEMIELTNYNAPKCIIIKFNNTDRTLNDFINVFPSIRVSKKFSEKILNIVPNIADVISNSEKLDEELDYLQPNVRFYKINEENDYINKIQPEKKENGLYERDNISNKDYFLYLDGSWYRTDKYWAIFYVHNIKNKSIIKYQNKKLTISKYIHLPELIDRALTMLSGKNPITKHDKIRIYENIDFNFADKIAYTLGQKLEVING